MKAFLRRLDDVLKLSWRRLQNVLKTSWQDVLKTFWRRIYWSWPRRLEYALWRRKVKANILVLIKTSWRRLEDVFWRGRWNTSSRCLQDVFMFAGPWLRTCFNAQKLMQTVVIDAFIYLFFYLFILSGFSFTNIHYSRDSRGRGGYLFNFSLPLQPASRTLRH